MSDKDVHVVLDTSSVVAFTNGSVSVGEILTEVAQTGGRVGIPVLCLAAAEYSIDANALVVWRMLIKHPCVDVLAGGIDPASAMRSVDGSILDGTVAFFATALNADVLTTQRDRYSDILPSDQVLSIDLDADASD